jgi:hypothetical protein
MSIIDLVAARELEAVDPQLARATSSRLTSRRADSSGLISRTNHGQMIKGPTAAVGDQASDLRLLGSGGGI